MRVSGPLLIGRPNHLLYDSALIGYFPTVPFAWLTMSSPSTQRGVATESSRALANITCCSFDGDDDVTTTALSLADAMDWNWVAVVQYRAVDTTTAAVPPPMHRASLHARDTIRSTLGLLSKPITCPPMPGGRWTPLVDQVAL